MAPSSPLRPAEVSLLPDLGPLVRSEKNKTGAVATPVTAGRSPTAEGAVMGTGEPLTSGIAINKVTTTNTAAHRIVLRQKGKSWYTIGMLLLLSDGIYRVQIVRYVWAVIVHVTQGLPECLLLYSKTANKASLSAEAR